MVTATATLVYLGIGAVVGAAGQGARAVVGIQKAKQDATDEELEDGSWWDARRLYLSLFVGAIAGVLFVAVGIDRVAARVGSGQTQDVLLTLVGVGYGGTDFIEGVLRGRGRGGGSQG